MDAVAKTSNHSPGSPQSAKANLAVEAARRQRRHRDAPSGGSELRPIGEKRLRELREAIRNGTYPRQETVEQGLARLFERSVRRPQDAE